MVVRTQSRSCKETNTNYKEALARGIKLIIEKRGPNIIIATFFFPSESGKKIYSEILNFRYYYYSGCLNSPNTPEESEYIMQAECILLWETGDMNIVVSTFEVGIDSKEWQEGKLEKLGPKSFMEPYCCRKFM